MKMIATILIAIALVNIASAGQSTRFNWPDPANLEKYNLADLLEYACVDILPTMDYLNYINPFFGNLKTILQPVCKYILEAADSPEGLNGNEFCNFMKYYLQISQMMGPARNDSSGPYAPLELSALEVTLYRVVANVSRNLYGIDFNDPATICPQAHLLFQPSLLDMLEDFSVEYYAELISALIPQLESICRNRRKYFASLGISDSSPYQRLVDSLLDIGSDAMGYGPSYDDMCLKMKTQKVFGQEWTHLKLFSKLLVIGLRNQFLREQPIESFHSFRVPPQMFSANITH